MNGNVSRALTTTTRRLLLTILAAITLLAPATVAGAAGRTPVDPSITQPALNPTFTWTCWRIDDKTMCDGQRHDSWTAVDTGIPCAGGTIYSTGTDDRFLRRWGDAQGLALHSHGVADTRETLALNPEMTGTTAQAFGHFSQRFSYGIPGDASTRVEVFSGNDITVVVHGTGLVMHDVGVKSFDIEDNVLFAHGPHEVLDDFEAAFDKVCDALQG
jgi:hypothetical protein